MRFISLFFFFAIVSACKHDPLLTQDSQKAINVIAADYIFTGDSTLVSNDGVEVSISPGIGEVNAQKYYIAPSTLLSDSLRIKITVKNESSTKEKIITVVKKDVNDTIISFNRTIMPLMVGNCNFRACHGNGSKGGNVELTSYESTLKHVIPYKPKQSILYLSLIKPDPLRRMPPAGALHQYRVAYFYKWIEQGAADN